MCLSIFRSMFRSLCSYYPASFRGIIVRPREWICTWHEPVAQSRWLSDFFHLIGQLFVCKPGASSSGPENGCAKGTNKCPRADGSFFHLIGQRFVCNPGASSSGPVHVCKSHEHVVSVRTELNCYLPVWARQQNSYPSHLTVVFFQRRTIGRVI